MLSLKPGRKQAYCSPCNQEKQILYDKYLVDLASDRGALEFAKEQGIEQGIEQEKNNIVKSMYKEGAELPFISKITGLSLEKIENIIKPED